MTAVFGETVGNMANGERPETTLETPERMRIAAILAGQQAVVVTVRGDVAYEPTIAGQGQPFANWARSNLWYQVTVNGETPPR